MSKAAHGCCAKRLESRVYRLKTPFQTVVLGSREHPSQDEVREG